VTSVRAVRTKRSAKQFARGQRGRNFDHFDTRVRQDRVERRRELPGPIADEESEPGDVFAEVYEEVAGLLSGPVGFQNPAMACDQRFQAARV